MYNFPTNIPVQRILEKIPSKTVKQNNDSEDNSNVFDDSRIYIYLR